MESDGYLVSDSEETDGEATILYNPLPPNNEINHDKQLLVSDNNNLLTEPEAREGKVNSDSIENDVPNESEHNDRRAARGRWSLRERTAIQKLPYSLERIKHRQQLEGFDVSNFDIVSNNITLNLPSIREGSEIPFTANNISQENEGEVPSILLGNSEQNFNNLYDLNYDSDFTDNPNGEISESDSSVTSDHVSNKSNDSEIIFRGRVVNMKRGYRGILPRSTWEKQIEKKNKAAIRTSQKIKSVIEPHKGVALRKRSSINNRNLNQDDALLSELIVDDNDVEGPTRRDEKLYLSGGKSQFNENELEKLSNYYQDKYQYDEYISDDNISETDLYPTTNQGFGNTNFAPTSVASQFNLSHSTNREVVTISSDDLLSDESVYLISDDDHESGFDFTKEDNFGLIDAMLFKDKRPRNRTKRNDIPSANERRIVNTERKRRNRLKTKRVKTNVVKRSIRGPRYTHDLRKTLDKKNLIAVQTRNREIHVAIRHSTVRLDDENTIDDFGRFTSKEETNTKTKKRKLSRPKANTSKNVPSFLTVIEALGTKYANTTHKKVSNLDNTASTSSFVSENESSLKMLDILLDEKTIDPPNTIKIALLGKDYVMAKYNSSNVFVTLGEIFSLIINQGISDVELVHSNDLITEFLYQFNNSSVLELIEQFHRDFRSKVNNLREKAKPIHFYQISICQLLLLEVSQYTNTSNVVKLKISSKIVENIISFFKLLSVCYLAVSSNDLEYLFESYNVLASVVDILKLKDNLWDRMGKEQFFPQIALIICNIFPTEKPKWNILKLRHDYMTLSSAFRFVKHCTKVCRWTISDDLILLFDSIFKKRRFMDFSEEHKFSERNYVISSPKSKLPAVTLFNKYLNILRITEISISMQERIIPIGEISATDAESIVKNRLNLLIILAKHSSFNLDKRFENLIKPLLKQEFIQSQKHERVKQISISILNATLSFFKINSKKSFPFRIKHHISLTYKTLIESRPYMDEIWSHFLVSLSKHFKLNGLRSIILKDLYTPFVHILTKENPTDFNEASANILKDLYFDNLEILELFWIQNSILPVIKNKAEVSFSWINYYCRLGKYLVMKNETSWWSFQMYSSLNGNNDVKIRFNTELIELCDSESFKIMKRNLFDFATKQLLKNNSMIFREFLFKLVKKETGTRYEIFLQDIEKNQFVKLKIYFQILKRLHSLDQTTYLIDEIERLYETKNFSESVSLNIVKFLNKNYVDEIKDCHSFILLKRKLNISNVETEKSLFRDTMRSFKNLDEQVTFLEKSILDSIEDFDDFQNVTDKIISLFDISIQFNGFKIFSTMLSTLSNSIAYEEVCDYLVIGVLKILNQVLESRFYQVGETEYLELCKIYSIASVRWDVYIDRLPREKLILQENIIFQLKMLKMSDGFWEQEHLAKLSENIVLLLNHDIKTKEPTQLQYKVEKIMKEYHSYYTEGDITGSQNAHLNLEMEGADESVVVLIDSLNVQITKVLY